MAEETKEQIEVILKMLRTVLIKNNVSMAMDCESKQLLFFDTNIYLDTKRISGIGICIDDLVKGE